MNNLHKNPCFNNFKNYREKNMKICVENGVYKEIIKEGFGDNLIISNYKINFQYDLYFENKEDPFDSNWITKKYGVIHEVAGIY